MVKSKPKLAVVATVATVVLAVVAIVVVATAAAAVVTATVAAVVRAVAKVVVMVVAKVVVTAVVIAAVAMPLRLAVAQPPRFAAKSPLPAALATLPLRPLKKLLLQKPLRLPAPNWSAARISCPGKSQRELELSRVPCMGARLFLLPNALAITPFFASWEEPDEY